MTTNDERDPLLAWLQDEASREDRLSLRNGGRAHAKQLREVALPRAQMRSADAVERLEQAHAELREAEKEHADAQADEKKLEASLQWVEMIGMELDDLLEENDGR